MHHACTQSWGSAGMQVVSRLYVAFPCLSSLWWLHCNVCRALCAVVTLLLSRWCIQAADQNHACCGIKHTSDGAPGLWGGGGATVMFGQLSSSV
jgi:hypothetical protein